MNEETKKALEEEKAAQFIELEVCVEMVLRAGLATGHADTHEDLMAEVLSQIAEIRKRASN